MTLTHIKPYMALIIFIIVSGFNSLCLSQNLSNLSNEFIAQGGTGVAAKGISSLYSNPSGTVSLDKTTLTVNYYMPYFIKELSTQNISAATPTKYGIIHATINRYGYKYYNESRFSIGFAKFLSPKFNIAFQFNLQHNQISESGNGQQVFSSFGIQFSPYPEVNIGFFTLNPEKAKLKIEDKTEILPSYINLGIRWNSSNRFSLSSEVLNQVYGNTITRFGLEYKINNIFIARTGVYGKPITYTIGLGLLIENFTIDISTTNHQTLGLSSGIGLTYQIN